MMMDRTHSAILNLQKERDERRRNADDEKKRKVAEAKDLLSKGKYGDSDFVSMIERFRTSTGLLLHSKPYIPGTGRINVAVRKRPLGEKDVVGDREPKQPDHDSVSCSNPFVVVHHCKLKVDGITKMLENSQFEFDYAFDENAANDDVYRATCLSLVEYVVLEDGKSTVFAYGQTGSGKTYTMEGLQQRVARDIFKLARTRATREKIVRVKCSNFELYGAQCFDLLNDRRVCAVREDGQGEIHIDGLMEEEASDEADFLEILSKGAVMRTTRRTEMNDDSSRSHSIFQVTLSSGGKLSLIDLAGSERGQDTKKHDSQRRAESAAINKSLLALKECIRALDPASGCAHVPYRGSKLTMVLKDSFQGNSKTVMISCVSPAASSSDHTLNTLRYADRVKAKHHSNNGSKSPKAGGANPMSIPQQTMMTSSTAPPSQQQHQQRPTSGVFGKQANQLISSQKTKSPAAPPPTNLITMKQRSTSPAAQKRLRQPTPFNPNPSFISNNRSLNVSSSSLINTSDMSDEREEEAEGVENVLPGVRRISSSSSTTTSNRVVRQPEQMIVEQEEDNNGADYVDVASASRFLVDEEEAFLASYKEAVQENYHLLTEEAKLLNEIDQIVDYDIEDYTKKLRDVLEQKLRIFEDLHERLVLFQDNFRIDE